MEKFLEIRNSVAFDDKVPLHENRREYSSKIKEFDESLDDETRKLLEWDMQLLCLSECVLHTTLNTSRNRLEYADRFEDDRVPFYKLLADLEKCEGLKVRYLDYLVDKVEGKDRFETAKSLINSLEHLIQINIEDIYHIISPMSRLVDISVRFNMKDKIESTSDLILNICNELVLKNDVRWILELSQLQRYLCYYKSQKRIPQQTIDRMIEIIKIGAEHYEVEKMVHLQQSFVWELINWYRSEKYPEEEIQRNIQKIGEAFEFEAYYQGGREQKSSFVEAHFLEEAVQLYSDYGFANKVDELKHKIREAYQRTNGEMKGIPFEFSIRNEELENYYNNFKGNTVEDTFRKISHYVGLLQEISEVEKRTQKAIQDYPLSHLMSKTRISADRKVYDANNEEKHVEFEFYTQYNYGIVTGFSIFYKYSWGKLVEDGLTLQMVKERLLTWDYFDEESRQFIERGLDRFWEKDYISALHILVPQFENTCRQFFHYGKHPTTVIRKDAVQQEQTFNQFLEQDFVKINIPENFRFFVKYIMVEELGFNLRNNIAHGLARLSDFTEDKCLIVIYAFFVLTLFGWKNQE